MQASDQGEQGRSSIDVASMGKPGPNEAAKGDQEPKGRRHPTGWGFSV